MQVNTSIIAASIPKIEPGRPAAAAPQSGETTEFKATEALEARLREVPDARPEAVERGTKLVESTQYPPPELINRLSRFLAQKVEEPLE